ncbi:MAG TPA: hypothetical protein VMV68_02070 [Spirochaetia bacterium]|nr:hypothetical protein [Spirochaetia bacterium]
MNTIASQWLFVLVIVFEHIGVVKGKRKKSKHMQRKCALERAGAAFDLHAGLAAGELRPAFEAAEVFVGFVCCI